MNNKCEPTIQGKMIREARESAGLIRDELSVITGVPSRTIGGWEQGKSVPPDYIVRWLLRDIEEFKNR